MRGRELGFGMETQAREEETGLKSARGRMRRLGEDILVVGEREEFEEGNWEWGS